MSCRNSRVGSLCFSTGMKRFVQAKTVLDGDDPLVL
jgi:hypothetical protein